MSGECVTIVLTQEELLAIHRALSMIASIWSRKLQEGEFTIPEQRALANALILQFEDVRERLPPAAPLS